ncbi:MAG: TlpA family protein disulfide reductase [Bdellovibrionales bacterium]|nr:TlpA family protein disulfide reductase [Bdellovibrionales bacterium]
MEMLFSTRPRVDYALAICRLAAAIFIGHGLVLPTAAYSDELVASTVGPALLSTLRLNDTAPVEPQTPRGLEVQLGSLEFTDLSGSPWTPTEPSPRQVVLYFWSLHCHGCVDTLRELQRLRAEFAARNVDFLSVHLFEPNPARVRSFLEMVGLNLETVLGSSGIREALDIRVLPTSLIFDAEGKLASRIDGMDGSDTLEISVFGRLERPIPPENAQ